MRRRAEWMVPADDKLLEYLESKGPDLPTNMADHIDLTRKYIGQRARILTEHNLLVNRGGGLYDITKEGRAYLAGEPDASELDDQDSD